MAEGSLDSTGIDGKWIVVCSFVGAGFWAAAFLTSDGLGWVGVFPEWMLHVGTAIGLAGLLFLLERRFERSVSATKELIEGAEQRFEARSEALTSRVDELGEQFRSGLAARSDAQDSVIQALADDFSFSTVTAALETANDLAALAYGYPTVQASADPDELALEVRWFTGPYLGGREDRFDPTLTLLGRFGNTALVPARDFVVAVVWEPGMSAADASLALATELLTKGRWKSSDTLDWELAATELVRTLNVAVRSRRRTDGAWQLNGALLELVGVAWALSEAGIEHVIMASSSRRARSRRGASECSNGAPRHGNQKLRSGRIRTSGPG